MASQLPPDAALALQQLLLGLASRDNDTRKNAEESLNNEWVKGRPEMLLTGLAEQTAAAPDSSVSLHPSARAVEN